VQEEGKKTGMGKKKPATHKNAEGEGEHAPPEVATRWRAHKHTVRLINIIAETKEEFLVRDKPLSREQLDAAPRNWYWQKAAAKLRDASFMPELHFSSDPYFNDAYEEKRLTPKVVLKSATAERCAYVD
jgi:hypothetical protein